MTTRLNKLFLFAGVLLTVVCFYPRAFAFVLQGEHILELMVEKLGQAESLFITQKVIFYNISTPSVAADSDQADPDQENTTAGEDVAAPEDVEYSGAQSLQGKRIATSYVATLTDYLQRNKIDAEIVYFSGAVEIAPKLGKADFICDLVSSGATLTANHLGEVETVLESEAVVIQTREPLSDSKQEWVNRILQRLDGVLQVRESKYIMLHAPRAALAEISALLPGAESPTVIPLDGSGDKVAVHAVCRETVFWETLENLKAAGASSLLVLPVEKMLA